MTMQIIAVGFLTVLAFVTLLLVGWDLFVFGIAAAIAALDGWWFWLGAAIALAQVIRLARRRWSRRDAGPISN